MSNDRPAPQPARRGSRLLPRLSTAAVLILLIRGGCGHGGSAPAADDEGAASGAPDLVLVMAGGLRSGAFDGAEEAFIGGLGAEPTHRFTAAYCQSLAPLTSLVSVLSGRYPSAVPFCGLHSGTAEPDARLWCTRLPTDRHYLPGVLAAYGYQSALFTTGLAGADVVDGLFGHTEVLAGAGEDVPWEQLGRAAADWWTGAAASPRLLVIVVADMGLEQHMAFTPAEGAATVVDETGKRHRVIEAAGALPAYVEVAGGVGQHLGEVVRGLDASDRPRWMAATSLHGLSVGERTGTADANDGQIAWQLGHLAHHIILDRTVHVPLVLFAPGGGRAQIVTTPTELVDLYPTFLALAGAAPSSGLPGEDVLAPVAGSDQTAFVEFGDMLALRSGNHLLTFRAYVPDRSSLDPEITDRMLFESIDGEKYSLSEVATDPLQLRNQVHGQWATTLQLRQQVIGIRQGIGAPPAGTLDSGRVRELRLNAREGYW